MPLESQRTRKLLMFLRQNSAVICTVGSFFERRLGERSHSLSLPEKAEKVAWFLEADRA